MIRHLYRVSATLLIVLLILVPVNAAQTCPPSRLKQGEQAQVVGTPNRLRDAASTSGNRIGEIPAGQPFTVLEVGECEGDIRWVRVSYNGQEGWTAEGIGAEYFIEPVVADATVSSSGVQPDTGFQSVLVTSNLQDFVWVNEDTYAVRADDAIALYTVSDPTTPVRTLPDEKFDSLYVHPSLPGILLAVDSYTQFVVYDALQGTELFRMTGPEPEQYGNEDAFDLRPQPPRFVLEGQQLHLQTVDEHIIVRTADWQIIERIVFENTLRVEVFISPDARWIVEKVGFINQRSADELRLPLLDRQTNVEMTLDRGGARTEISHVDYSYDSRYLIATDSNGDVNVWDLSQSPPVRTDYSAAAWREASLENRYASQVTAYRVVSHREEFDSVRPQIELVVIAPDGTVPVRIVQAGRSFLNGSVNRDGSSLLIVTDENELFLGNVAVLAQAGVVELEAPPPTPTVSATSQDVQMPVQFRCGTSTTSFEVNSHIIVIGELPTRLRSKPSTDAPVLRGIEPGTRLILGSEGLCINGIVWRYVFISDSNSTDAGWIAESVEGELLMEAVTPDSRLSFQYPLRTSGWNLALSNTSVDLYSGLLNILDVPLQAATYTDQDTLLTSDSYDIVEVYPDPGDENAVYLLVRFNSSVIRRNLVSNEMTRRSNIVESGNTTLEFVPATQANIVYFVINQVIDGYSTRVLRMNTNNGEVTTVYDTSAMTLAYSNLGTDFPIDETLLALTISPDGRTIAQIIEDGNDYRLELIDIASGTVRTLTGFQSSTNRGKAVFSPDGSHLAVATSVGSDALLLTLWDIAQDTVILSDSAATEVSKLGFPLFFSPDGSMMVAGTNVYDTSDGEQVANGVDISAFTPDSRLAAVMINDTTSRVVLLDTTTWESVGEIVLPNITAPVSP